MDENISTVDPGVEDLLPLVALNNGCAIHRLQAVRLSETLQNQYVIVQYGLLL